MTRHLALFLLAASTPLSAAGLPRTFTVTSFDRIRMEAPYAVTLTTGRAPSARAEGSPQALDAIDLRVEGTTLILRQRSGFGSDGSGSPVRIMLSTPSLRTALMVGAGSLAIDRMDGLSVDLAMQGSGVLSVGRIAADKVNAAAQGSGKLSLAGTAKMASYLNRGTASLAADALAADEVVLSADGAGDAAIQARREAKITAAGPVQVRVSGEPACIVKAIGSAMVSGCRVTR
ncbi:GIN domain-containing protein [Sphingomonas astaxanthinifaciens]|uniref:Putative auto-transporter adhesin head GIN domain-containing protein n=1 Tax=Sphingomonas astaxanthinifaciens DSM 22298 TaxID=1123267 RepID=A0ABQ5Z8Q8_9SPHN|nr:DUF2807 domain-containing protein [Sphingomonas astaxanthinifaciens]GLR48317.1 hypothetical protein GCM10007925_20310 [Sphingomonas astaxanthinifaciens DSM 22298]